jgi:hypothetical protein
MLAVRSCLQLLCALIEQSAPNNSSVSSNADQRTAALRARLSFVLRERLGRFLQSGKFTSQWVDFVVGVHFHCSIERVNREDMTTRSEDVRVNVQVDILYTVNSSKSVFELLTLSVL